MILIRIFVFLPCIAVALLGCAAPPTNVNQDEDVVVHKVPLLGDIPLLGALFRSSERKPTRHLSNTATSQTNGVVEQGVATPTTQTNDLTARLMTLKALRDGGSITEAEYEGQRKALVDQL